MSKKKRHQNEDIKEYYPSAELLKADCYEDYKRLIETYDKIYEKINIALAFCGVILLVIISDFDYRIIGKLINSETYIEGFTYTTLLICSLLSVIMIIWAVIQLLLLTRSREIKVFDSIAVRKEEIYREKPEVAAMWLIDKYTIATNELRTVIADKNKEYDVAILKLVISILSFAVVVIIKKGL